MKPSPLQLDWIVYPRASFEVAAHDVQASNGPVEAVVRPEVRYFADGHHVAMLSLESKADSGGRYTFAIDVFARFSFDLERARLAYGNNLNLPGTIAANVSRILYSSAREMLSAMTARGAAGTAVIESVIIEPSDVKIESDETAEFILRNVFQYEDHPAFHMESKSDDSSRKPPGKRRDKAERSKA